MKTQTLTLQDLVVLQACENQRSLFRQTFGDEVRITPVNIALAMEKELSVLWIVNRLHAVLFQCYTDDSVLESVDLFRAGWHFATHKTHEYDRAELNAGRFVSARQYNAVFNRLAALRKKNKAWLKASATLLNMLLELYRYKTETQWMFSEARTYGRT